MRKVEDGYLHSGLGCYYIYIGIPEPKSTTLNDGLFELNDIDGNDFLERLPTTPIDCH